MKRSEIINMKTIALIFAGGVGARMKHPNLPKQFIKVEDKPIIIHTIEYFELNKNVDEIYVVCVKEYIDYLHELIAEFKITKVKCVVPGGKTGQDSIYNGLVEISKNNNDNKSINKFIDETKNINCELDLLVKTKYSDEEKNLWQNKIMKNALDNWFMDNKNMLIKYNNTINYCRELEKMVNDLKNSTSWKITKPIRSIKIILIKIYKKFFH